MNKIVLITGCSSGIGKSLARQFALRGHTVIAGARNTNAITSLGDSVHPIRLDVTDADEISQAVSYVKNKFGRLDLLINNAGYGAMGPVAEVPLPQVQKQFSTNVYAPLALTQMFLPLLKQSTSSIVVNIGSAAGVFTVPFSGIYGASKAALHALSDVLRMELKPFGIHVMTVYPGAVASDFGETAANKLKDTLASDSAYAKALPAIEKRARISSNSPTTPDMFADELIAALSANRPKDSIRIGYGSRLMFLAKAILSSSLRERLLGNSYMLTRSKLGA